jgi:hypothetical protein
MAERASDYMKYIWYNEVCEIRITEPLTLDTDTPDIRTRNWINKFVFNNQLLYSGPV